MQILLLLLLAAHIQLVAQQSLPQVLILGSYHMDNPGLDAFNMEADDVTSPKRQKEIAEFVKLLTTYKPTKICLEYPFAKQTKLQENYRAYLDGQYLLSKSETDQIGFRLAKKMGLQEVYAIDSQAPFSLDTVIKTAQKYRINSFLEILAAMPQFIEAEGRRVRESTITEIYDHFNSDEYVRMSHEWYLKMVAVGKDDNFAGADLMADWYKRNLRIYRNLLLLNPSIEDRILIIIGAGHAKILQDLVEESSAFELVKLQDLGKRN